MIRTSSARRALSTAIVLSAALAQAPIGARAEPRDAREPGDLKVTVHYTGAGTVDPSHRLWIWLFDTPDIGPGAMPIGESSVQKNGDTASFTGLGATRVWIAVAYDEAGGFTGSAPPPSGAPVGIHLGERGPEAVVPGPGAAVKVTFDASMRMP